MNNTLINQTKTILQEEDDLAAIYNLVSLLFNETEDINWLGLYLYKNNELVLGPFQGKVACTHIQINNGVCGTSFYLNQILNIENVHEFKGHIACDSASNSELVLPINYLEKRIGVLDIDSTSFNRFSKDDEETFNEITKLIGQRIKNINIQI